MFSRPPRDQRRRARRPILAAILAGATLAALPAGATAADGDVNFERNATSSFAIPWITESTDAEQDWMRTNYERMRGYPPFHDQALSWGPSTDFYQDLYAVYRDVSADQQLMQQHPDWILRDNQGRKLFIPYACSGGTCPAYAADIGNAQWRQHWINAARDELDKGYTGIFIDNVNMEMMVGDGAGQTVRPINPRTDAPMSDVDWRRYVAEFTEQIDAALPDATVTHNSGQWWTSESDPYYRREVQAADRVELERGFNDTGLTGGTGTFGFLTYVDHVDWLHEQGADVVLEPYNLDQAKATFELASYFLVTSGDDAISTDYRANPDNFWSGWDAKLGTAEGDRYTSDGVLRRDFTGGAVLVNPPGASQRQVDLPSDSTWKTLAGDEVTSVTLGAHDAAVLTKDPGDTVEEPPPPARELTLKPNRHRVGPAGQIRLSGVAPEGTTTVAVMVKVDGTWSTTVEEVAVVEGAYAVALPARPRGVRRYRAKTTDGLASGTRRIRIAPAN